MHKNVENLLFEENAREKRGNHMNRNELGVVEKI